MKKSGNNSIPDGWAYPTHKSRQHKTNSSITRCQTLAFKHLTRTKHTHLSYNGTKAPNISYFYYISNPHFFIFFSLVVAYLCLVAWYIKDRRLKKIHTSDNHDFGERFSFFFLSEKNVSLETSKWHNCEKNDGSSHTKNYNVDFMMERLHSSWNTYQKKRSMKTVVGWRCNAPQTILMIITSEIL